MRAANLESTSRRQASHGCQRPSSAEGMEPSKGLACWLVAAARPGWPPPTAGARSLRPCPGSQTHHTCAAWRPLCAGTRARSRTHLACMPSIAGCHAQHLFWPIYTQHPTTSTRMRQHDHAAAGRPTRLRLLGLPWRRRAHARRPHGRTLGSAGGPAQQAHALSEKRSTCGSSTSISAAPNGRAPAAPCLTAAPAAGGMTANSSCRSDAAAQSRGSRAVPPQRRRCRCRCGCSSARLRRGANERIQAAVRRAAIEDCQCWPPIYNNSPTE